MIADPTLGSAFGLGSVGNYGLCSPPCSTMRTPWRSSGEPVSPPLGATVKSLVTRHLPLTLMVSTESTHNMDNIWVEKDFPTAEMSQTATP